MTREQAVIEVRDTFASNKSNPLDWSRISMLILAFEITSKDVPVLALEER